MAAAIGVRGGRPLGLADGWPGWHCVATRAAAKFGFCRKSICLSSFTELSLNRPILLEAFASLRAALATIASVFGMVVRITFDLITFGLVLLMSPSRLGAGWPSGFVADTCFFILWSPFITFSTYCGM